MYGGIVFSRVWFLLRQLPKIYKNDNEKKENKELYINGFLSPMYAPAMACRLVV